MLTIPGNYPPNPNAQEAPPKEDEMEQALKPLFEKIQDETDEVYFQDSNGRILKIVLWAEPGGEEAVDLEDLHQNLEAENQAAAAEASFQRACSPSSFMNQELLPVNDYVLNTTYPPEESNDKRLNPFLLESPPPPQLPFLTNRLSLEEE